MNRSLRWRTLGLLGIVLVCVCMVLPSFVGARQLPSWFPFQRAITLGLDLEGGSHVVYSIDLDEAVTERALTIKRDLDAGFADAGLQVTVRTPRQPVGAITVIPQDSARRAEIAAQITADYGDTIESRTCGRSDEAGAICVRVSTRYAEGIKRAALSNAVTIIRERIDEIGVAEPSVVEKGDEIIVELPGLDTNLIAATRSVIARTAKLEFKAVVDGSDYMRRLYAHVGSAGREGIPTDPRARRDEIYAEIDQWQDNAGTRHTDYYLFARDRRHALPIEEARRVGCVTRSQRVETTADGKVWCDVSGRDVLQRYVDDLAATDPSFAIPDDRQLGFEFIEPMPLAADPRPLWRTYYLERAVQLTGTSIEDVAAAYDPNTNQPIVLLDFTRLGGRVFGQLTQRIAGAKLATILDGRIRSAPVITEPIRGGRASITLGGGDPKRQERERNELVNVLKTGSLPAPLQEESASEVGPTLGQDAIERAKVAFALGVAIVVVILVWIYRTSGAIALVTLSLNILFVLTLLVAFDATLTLPGIAGIVLVFGMAVDGNIIIFERIREELDRNKSIQRSVDVGYSRAFAAIIDGQLTTMAGGFVLFVYGTGPITGFAVTLIMGNFTALFANIWCTRVLYDHYLNHLRRRNKPLAI